MELVLGFRKLGPGLTLDPFSKIVSRPLKLGAHRPQRPSRGKQKHSPQAQNHSETHDQWPQRLSQQVRTSSEAFVVDFSTVTGPSPTPPCRNKAQTRLWQGPSAYEARSKLLTRGWLPMGYAEYTRFFLQLHMRSFITLSFFGRGLTCQSSPGSLLPSGLPSVCSLTRLHNLSMQRCSFYKYPEFLGFPCRGLFFYVQYRADRAYMALLGCPV